MRMHVKVLPVQTVGPAWMKRSDSRVNVLNSGEDTIVQVIEKRNSVNLTNH